MDKEQILADLKGVHGTVTDLINGLGSEVDSELKPSKDDMNVHFQGYLGDIAMLIENRFFDTALKMARSGQKIDWRKDE